MGHATVSEDLRESTRGAETMKSSTSIVFTYIQLGYFTALHITQKL